MSQPKPPLFENLVLDYEALAKLLKVSVVTLKRHVSAGRIPHCKVGSQVRFYWPAIEDWLRGLKPKRS